MNSDLIIKTKINKNESLEFIDYLNSEIIEKKIKINSSGVLCRKGTNISFNQGDNLPKSPFDLLTIEKNSEIGKYIINCGNWSKDLNQLVEEQGAFIVYRGLSLKEYSSNFNYRYYKLSQGDIFKLGNIYFKVLDIYLNKDKINKSRNIKKRTLIKNASYSSFMINGQQILTGEYSSNIKKININSTSDKLNNNSLLNSKKSDYSKNESVDFSLNKKEMFPKISPNHKLSSMTKKPKKNININTNIRLVLKKPINNIQSTCRICYGDFSYDENPLISPCKCKGSMKYIHYKCLKNWLNSKIEDDILKDSYDNEVHSITYKRKDVSCELCNEQLPDYVKYNNRYYNISFYKPNFGEFMVLESMATSDKEKIKYIHLISFDNKNSIIIGRSKECELSINDISLSSYHSFLRKEQGEIYIEDNSSKYGTLILIQNNNMIMNDLVPLKLQINKTFIKLKVKYPFYKNLFSNQDTSESINYNYQKQNKKCFDIESFFIVKEEEPENTNDYIQEEQSEEIKNDNNVNTICKLGDNKDIIKNDNCLLKETEKNENIISNDNSCHFNAQSTLFKKRNIKNKNNERKERNEISELPVLNNNSPKCDKRDMSKVIHDYQQKNKNTIRTIRLNNYNPNFYKIQAKSNTKRRKIVNNINNIRKNYLPKINNNYSNINKSQKRNDITISKV